MADNPRDTDPRPTPELVAAAIRGDADDEQAWRAVRALQGRATREVVRAAQALCASALAKERARGADILGELGMPERAFPDEAFEALNPLLDADEVPEVLRAAAFAVGHSREPRAVPRLSALRDHPSADVRYAVVCGLLCQEDPAAVSAMIELSRDPDDDVRNWATFGLGSQIDLDTPEIREALWARIEDSHDETRGEAIVGLARRNDDDVVPIIKARLEAGWCGALALEAAVEVADGSLLPALHRLRGKASPNESLLERAIEACGRSRPQ